jgi:hypothetical protein
VIEARPEMGWAASMTEQAGWRHRCSYWNQVAAWSEREVEVLRRWHRYGAPEARSLDGGSPRATRRLARWPRGRERQLRTLDRFQLDRTKSRLGDSNGTSTPSGIA